jgi:hypothetical protein
MGCSAREKKNDCQRSRDSSVGIATRYGLDGPGIKFRWGPRFSAPVQTGSEAHPASYTMGTGSFPGVKRPGRGVDHPPHLEPRLKKEYNFTFTTPFGPSWPVTVTCTLCDSERTAFIFGFFNRYGRCSLQGTLSVFK